MSLDCVQCPFKYSGFASDVWLRMGASLSNATCVLASRSPHTVLCNSAGRLLDIAALTQLGPSSRLVLTASSGPGSTRATCSSMVLPPVRCNDSDSHSLIRAGHSVQAEQRRIVMPLSVRHWCSIRAVHSRPRYLLANASRHGHWRGAHFLC